MKRLNKAFTLTELLVALGVIGVLCAILLPVIFNLLLNKNTIMAKRAYYTVQTVVADLINDEACYPDLTNASDTDKRVGFDDGFGYANCSKWGGDENTGTIDYEGNQNTKFLTLFKDKLDIGTDNGTSFTTKDGMQWIMHTQGFTNKNNKNAMTLITVDVNGKDSPNCSPSSNSSKLDGYESCSGKTKGYDRFTIGVYADGRIKIDSNDTWASNAVQVNRNITGDGTSNDNDDTL